MLNRGKVTSDMWDEYEEYLNDCEWREVTEGMTSSDKYDFLIKTKPSLIQVCLKESYPCFRLLLKDSPCVQAFV